MAAWSYTTYPDYDIEQTRRTDNFANSESVVRLGVGYRFGAESEEEGEALPAYLPDGFYAGAQQGGIKRFGQVIISAHIDATRST